MALASPGADQRESTRYAPTKERAAVIRKALRAAFGKDAVSVTSDRGPRRTG